LKKPTEKQSKKLLQQNANSREAILAAALKAFARYGFDGASLPKIAQMAEVAPPLIHYYFQSKDNLWRETVDHSLGELRRESSAIQSATRALAPLDRLRALLQVITHFAARCPDHFSMIIAEARSESDHFAWVQENYTGVLFGDVVAILEAAKSEGLIKDVAIEHLAFMLIGGILIYFSIKPPLPKDKDLGQLADEYTDEIFKIFMEGVAVRKVVA
jgi:AcrR family transcriptional regulator